MKLPIQYALAYPERYDGPARRFDFGVAQQLELSPPDLERFPAVRLGYDVAARGGTAGVVLNAVNEEAVQAFLNGVVRFPQIAELCERAVSEHPFIGDPTLEDILRLDAWARKESQNVDVLMSLSLVISPVGLLGMWILQPASWLVILQVAIGLGFVIFVHELGHFLVAKACGVKCEKFYIGFDINGWNLGKFTWGETEYGIGILPLGGYVKMLGQDDNPAAAAREAQRAKDIMESGDLPPEPTSDPHPAWDPRSYPAQSVPERMAIISAGVIMNVIFAVLLAAWAFGLGVQELTCEVSSVRPGGAAWRAGLRTGDEIVAVGSKTEPVFTDLQKGVTLGDPSQGIDFTVRRPADGSETTLTLHPDTDLGIPTVGVTSPFSITLPESLEPGLPGAASQAEPAFEPGDTITAVDGVSVSTYAELIASLSNKVAMPVSVSVQRQNKSLPISVPSQPRRETGLVMVPGPDCECPS